MPSRRESVWSLCQTNWPDEGRDSHSSDVELIFTCKGIIVSGYFDSMMGIGRTP